MVPEALPDMAVGSLAGVPLWCMMNAFEGLPHSCSHTLVISAFFGRPTALRWSTSRSRDRLYCCPGPCDTIPSSLTAAIASWYADLVVQAACEDLSCSPSVFEAADSLMRQAREQGPPMGQAKRGVHAASKSPKAGVTGAVAAEA